jgi:hypothetical protein
MLQPFVFVLSPATIAANQDSVEPTLDEQIVALHLQRFGRRKIMLALNVGESYVRRVTKGIEVHDSQRPTLTPFDRSVKKCYPLAVSRHGIKDYQLRDILYREYDKCWNTETGKLDGSYSGDCLDRVRTRVRELAESKGETALFVMDWFDTTRPAQSNRHIRQCALNLAERVQEAVDEYMAACGVELVTEEGTPTEQVANLHRVEVAKQVAAARLHMIKLAIPDFSPEPVSRLLERADEQANGLAGTPDHALPKVESHKDYHPKPTGFDPFLDYVEGKGWLHPSYFSEVENAITRPGC